MRFFEISKSNKLGLCLRLCLSEIKLNSDLQLYKGPPGRKSDTAHFWLKDKNGDIHDLAKRVDSGVVLDDYQYKGKRVDPDNILSELNFTWDDIKLPKKYRINRSEISGNGAFANQDIKSGNTIGVGFEREGNSGDMDKDINRTRLGQHVNHSESPNCKLVYDKNRVTFVADTDIDSGSELTVDYSDFRWDGKRDFVNKPLAIIVKGNPKYLNRMKDAAESFHQDVQKRLERKGFRVEIDPGKPYTEPKPAQLWVGHSRGIDRLRFAPDDTVTLELQTKSNNGMDPNHYKLNDVDIHNIRNIRIKDGKASIKSKIDTVVYENDIVYADDVDSTLYHISFSDSLPDTMRPRYPDGAGTEGDNVEPMIERVSFSPTIEQCFRSIYPNISFYFEEKKYPHMDIWVYKAVLKDTNRIVFPETLTANGWVWDAHETDEHWLLDPVKINRIGRYRFFNPGNSDKTRMANRFNDDTESEQSIGPETVQYKRIR